MKETLNVTAAEPTGGGGELNTIRTGENAMN